MQFSHVLLAAAAIGAASSAGSTTPTENVALTACAHAFASSIAAPGSAAPTFKLRYLGSQATGGLAENYRREYTFVLQAHDPKTGLPVAQATCSASLKGTILALTATPTATATLAAKL